MTDTTAPMPTTDTQEDISLTIAMACMVGLCAVLALTACSILMMAFCVNHIIEYTAHNYLP